jgi:hypothetical protein
MGQTNPRDDFHKHITDNDTDISLDSKAQPHPLQQFAAAHKGLYLPNKIVNPDRLKFICGRLHIFVQTNDEVQANKWCLKCEDRQSPCDAVYSMDRLEGSKILFACHRGHKASKSLMEIRKFRSCEQCVLDQQQQQIKNEQKQKSLFETAQAKILQANQQSLEVITKVKEVFGSKLLSTKVLYSLYSKIDFKGVGTEEQLKVICVFFVLMHPDICREVLRCSEQESRRRAFRMLCLLLHPDKNSHSMAKKAFVCMLEIFKGV